MKRLTALLASFAALLQMNAQPVADGYARVTLANTIEFPGYDFQLLLDADATAYGIEINPRGGIENADYSCFEYTVPKDASFENATTTSVKTGQFASIDIPAGIYDLAVVWPTNDGSYCLFNNGVYDNFEFREGCEYEFTVILWQHTYELAVDLRVIYKQDLAIEAISIPGKKPFGRSEDINITIKNSGTETWNDPFGLSVDVDGTIYNLQSPSGLTLKSGESTSFSVKADLSAPGKHIVNASIISNTDLQPDNNLFRAVEFQSGAMNAPVCYDFENMLSTDEWTVIDRDYDGISWKFITDKMGNRSNTFAHIDYGKQYPRNDDYLVTTYPIILPEGECHVSFDFSCDNPNFPEQIEVLYGTTPDPSKMTQIWVNNRVTNTGFRNAAKDFVNPAAGKYYFAFHIFSAPYNGGVSLDNFCIDAGDNSAGHPDATVSLLIPEPSVALTNAETIRAEVTNIGTSDIKSLRLSYSINGSESHSQKFSFDKPLENAESAILTFDEKADLSAANVFNIEVKVSDVISQNGYTEENLSNNANTNATVHFAPKQLPLIACFAHDHDQSIWASRDRLWNYNPELAALRGNNDSNLLSCPVHLVSGVSYKFSMDYLAGELFLFFRNSASFNIVYGQAGTDVSSWKEISRVSDVYYNEPFYQEFEFKPLADGDYQFAIVPVTNCHTLAIKNICISRNTEYDVRILNLVAPSIVPKSQTESLHTMAKICNKSKKNADVEITLSADNVAVGNASVNQAPAGMQGFVDVFAALPGLSPGDTFVLTATPNVTASDDALCVPASTAPIQVSAYTYAYDRVKPTDLVPDRALKTEAEIMIASRFTISKPASLAALTFGWAGNSEASIPFKLFKFDSHKYTISDDIFSTTIEKGAGSGWESYTFDSVDLPVGEYLAAITINSAVIAADYSTDGLLYVIDPATKKIGIQNNLGYPAIRLELDGIASVDDTKLTNEMSIEYNKATKQLNILTDEAINQVAIYAPSGQIVLTAATATVDLHHLHHGMYIITVSTDSTTASRKIIIR